MASRAGKAATGLVVAAAIAGFATRYGPPSTSGEPPTREELIRQQAEDLSESQEQQKERYRRELNDESDRRGRERARAAEHRPRVRIP